jgi:hypothetical protein
MFLSQIERYLKAEQQLRGQAPKAQAASVEAPVVAAKPKKKAKAKNKTPPPAPVVEEPSLEESGTWAIEEAPPTEISFVEDTLPRVESSSVPATVQEPSFETLELVVVEPEPLMLEAPVESVEVVIVPEPEQAPGEAPSVSFNVLEFFSTYRLTEKQRTMKFKTMGLPIPLDLHKRISTYLEKHKGKAGYPQSMRELVFVSIKRTMDFLESEDKKEKRVNPKKKQD